MTKKIVHSFVIDERRWLHGEKDTPSYEGVLRNKEGKMCCLGFFAQSCGVKPKDMVEIGMPDALESKLPRKLLQFAFEIDKCSDEVELYLKNPVEYLSDANDDEGYTLVQRKRKITSLFKKLGVEVTFVNGSK